MVSPLRSSSLSAGENNVDWPSVIIELEYLGIAILGAEAAILGAVVWITIHLWRRW